MAELRCIGIKEAKIRADSEKYCPFSLRDSHRIIDGYICMDASSYEECTSLAIAQPPHTPFFRSCLFLLHSPPRAPRRPQEGRVTAAQSHFSPRDIFAAARLVDPLSRRRKLSRVAWEVRERAYTFGKTKVGCAVLSVNGKIFAGCNVEQKYRCHDVHTKFYNDPNVPNAPGDSKTLQT